MDEPIGCADPTGWQATTSRGTGKVSPVRVNPGDVLTGVLTVGSVVPGIDEVAAPALEVTETVEVGLDALAAIREAKAAEESLDAAEAAYVPKVGDKVYRVWGDGSKIGGRSWTPENPLYSSNYRNVAGLPNENSGENIAQGVLNDVSGIKVKAATALDGNEGGWIEYEIPNVANQVTITGGAAIYPPL